MGLRSLLFETENAPRRCLVWLIVIACCTAAVVWDGGRTDLKKDGPVLTLESKAILRQRFDRDTICTALAAGDSVRVLGIDRSSFGQKWLVETGRGDIGWIDASDLTGVRQIVTDGACKGDTVSVEARWVGSFIRHYAFTMDGEEYERSTDDFVPALDGWDDFAYNRDAYAGVCTRGKFEKMTLGKSPEEVRKSLGMPVLLRVTPEGMTARYSYKVFEPSTGEMSKPCVIFGPDSIATAVEFGDPTRRAASWLRHMPLASTIIDWPVTSLLIRGSRYDAMSDPMAATGVKALFICLIPVLLFMYFCWMFATQTLPVLLMGWLLRFPPVFKPLSDQWLRLLMLVVMLVCVYIQAVMMMAWGMFPFWSLLILIVGWYAFSLASSPLCTYPHCRCPACRHLYTIRFKRKELESSEIKKGSDIVRGRLLGRRKEKWRRWTEVTSWTRYSDGSTTVGTHRENLRNMARDISTYEYIDYEVTYRLDHYRLYHVCSECGHVEETTSVVYTELDRRRTGSHTAEVAGEEYDNGFGW